MATPLEVIQSRGIEHRQHGDRGSNAGYEWVQVDCPFCSPGSGKFRLGVHKARGSWNCWLCGPKRSTEAWAAVLHLDAKAARAITASVPRLDTVEDTRPTGKLVLPDDLGDLKGAHKRYLRSRGFDPDQLAAVWGVKGIGPEGGSLAWRIFIPIVYRGQMVSWTTRSLIDEGIRYVAAGSERESMRGKALLLGGDFVQHACVIHEGPMDVFKTGPGAVSLCGIAYTPAQVRLLSEIPRRVICFDSEPIAQQRARQLRDILLVYPGTTHVVELTSGKDAGSAAEAELQELREYAGIENLQNYC